MKMIKCVNCGVENNKNAKYCKACGESMEPAPSGEITMTTGALAMEDVVIKDRFKVLRRLGKGGMGEVFLAEDLKLKRNVAIKRIIAGQLADSTTKIRFLREAQTASQLDHTNICTIFEIYDDDRYDYIVMKYIDGVTLDQIIKHKPLTIGKTLDIAIQICDGMVEAHAQGIIHRDIKPGNIMVDNRGVVKILDFGLAKFGSGADPKQGQGMESNLTEKGIVLGTVSYLSPEQATGKPLDERSDIFSFGVVLFEMLEGFNPFKDEEQITTLYNVINKEIQFTRQLPAELESIIRNTLQKDKKDRCQTFVKLKADLELMREHYSHIKNTIEEPGTEIIDMQEQEALLNEMRHLSDKENLGDLVHRIKRFKASTERVITGRKNRGRLLIFFLALAVIGVSTYFILTYKKEAPKPVVIEEIRPKFYVFLEPFQNNTKDKDLPDQLYFLLNESLNQFSRFKVIGRQDAASILGDNGGGAINLEQLRKSFPVEYRLTGKISLVNDFYTIEGALIPLGTGKKEQTLTITGQGKDSFLINQVDNLSKRLYAIFFPNAHETGATFKNVSALYGDQWETFLDFYKGNQYKKRWENENAKKYLGKTRDLLAAKFALADLNYFEGNRLKSLEYITDIINQADVLPNPLKYRVLALQARLNFDFPREVENLEKLKNEFPFSRESFLELGNAYFHHGDATKALTYFQEALKLDREYSQAYNRMGYCYAYLGEHASAIQALEDYRRLDQTANSFDSLGDGYFYSGDYIDSESLKGLAVSTDEKSIPWAFLTLADIRILLARYNEARSFLDKYEKMMNSRTESASVLVKKAYIHYINREYDNALKVINQSLTLHNSDDINDHTAEAHWLKGVIALAAGRSEDAHLESDWLEVFKEKYKLSGDNFSAPFKYYLHLDALIDESEKKFDAAEKTFQYLISLKPRLSYWITFFNYQFFHTDYAAFLMRRGRWADALREITLCLDYNGAYPPALWVKADVMEKTGDMSRFQVYKKIAGIYKNSAEENYLRKKLKEKSK